MTVEPTGTTGTVEPTGTDGSTRLIAGVVFGLLTLALVVVTGALVLLVIYICKKGGNSFCKPNHASCVV